MQLRQRGLCSPISGGVQEETTYLGIPCFILRENTERPITISQGSNRLVKLETLEVEISKVLTDQFASGGVRSFGTGRLHIGWCRAYGVVRC